LDILLLFFAAGEQMYL